MPLRWCLIPNAHVDAHVFGATMAREHLRPFVEQLMRTPQPRAEDIVLDFSGVISATSSYLKRSILWLDDCARLSVEGVTTSAFEDHPIPLNIYVFVTNLSDEVRAELNEVLVQQNRICLEILPDVTTSIAAARLLGPLDPALQETLDLLIRMRQATATELHNADAAKRTVNAWNNRLSDLFYRRLARRSKVGRHWVYEPVAPEVHTHG